MRQHLRRCDLAEERSRSGRIEAAADSRATASMSCFRRSTSACPAGSSIPSSTFAITFVKSRCVAGTESDLKALASKIVSTHLERDKPLWDLTLVRGLEGNRTGLIARIHHCLADGIAGVGIMNVLMDQSPVAAPLAAQEAGSS